MVLYHQAGPAEYLALSQAVEAMLCEGYTSSIDKLNAAALDISSYSDQTPEGDLKQELEKVQALATRICNDHA